MRWLIILMAILLLLPIAIAAPSSITCKYDTTPYIRTDIPLIERPNIEWICYLDTADETGCISFTEYNGDIIQVNPDPKNINEYGVVDKFQSHNGLINVYFKSRDLRDDRTVVFGIKCGNLEFKANITPIYKDPYLMIDRGSWVFDNLSYFVMGFLVIVIFVFIGRRFMDWYRNG